MDKIHFGVDLHKNFSYVVGVKADGAVVAKARVNHEADGLSQYFHAHGAGAEVVVEATGNWMYFFEQVEPWVNHVTLAHPLKVKAIASARIKTDKIDAATLAHLLRSNLVPEAYIPTRATRELRETLRYRAWLVATRAGVKSKIRSVLLKFGLDCPYADVLGKKAQAWVRAVALPEAYRAELAGFLAVAATLTTLCAQVDARLSQVVTVTPDAERLLTIPGVGVYSALLILSELGTVTRFPDPKHLCSYAGLVPSTYQSGGTTRHGGLTKQGSKWLRWILVEISEHIIRKDQRFLDLFTRVMHRHGRNTAKVAVARQLLTIMWYMLKRQEPFRLVRLHEQPARRAPRGHGGVTIA